MSWCDPRGLRPCPTGLPELSHALGHPNSELASQFDRILNLSGIFAPLLPLDPSLKFWAPLDYTLNDLRGALPTFARDSAAVWRRDDGQHFLLPSNQPRFENAQLLIEPDVFNKNENWNADPDEALTGVQKSGAAESVLSRVLDQPALDAAGLSNITNGYMIELDNRLGGTVASATIFGTAGNLNTHTLSAWLYVLDQGTFCDMRMDTGTSLSVSNTQIEKQVISGNPTGVGSALQFRCGPGGRQRFIVNQFEELPAVSSPIITQGEAQQRGIDKLTYASANQFFSQVQGMALITMRPRFDKAALGTLENLLSVSSAAKANLLYYDTSFRSTDGVNTASVATPAYAKDDLIKVAVVYGPTGPGALQVGYSLNGAAWVWSAAAAYDGAFVTDDILAIVNACGIPVSVSDVRLYDENKGTAWVEANY